MPGNGPTSPAGRWVSVSELASYAYCPRSWWYDGHPPAEGRTVESGHAARTGVRYHARALRANRRRASWAVAGGIIVLTSLALLAVGALLGWWSA